MSLTISSRGLQSCLALLLFLATPRHRNNTSSTMSCNTCGKATSVVCNHFDVDGSIAPAARYCSKACQAVDWPTHKEECNKSKHRKQLYARGQFLQKVCYLFRKGSFEQSYDRVEKDSTGKLHIHDSTEDLDKFLFPFPHHLNLSLQDKQAVLCHLAFDEIAQLSRLLERLIKGLASSPSS